VYMKNAASGSYLLNIGIVGTKITDRADHAEILDTFDHNQIFANRQTLMNETGIGFLRIQPILNDLLDSNLIRVFFRFRWKFDIF